MNEPTNNTSIAINPKFVLTGKKRWSITSATMPLNPIAINIEKTTKRTLPNTYIDIVISKILTNKAIVLHKSNK